MDIADILQPGHHDDRDLLPLGNFAQLCARPETVHFGHHDVQKDNIGVVPFDRGDEVDPVGDFFRPIPGLFQTGPHKCAHGQVVVHDQDQRRNPLPARIT